LLSFQSIPTTATPEFSRAWPLYEEAFPVEERRSLLQQKELLTNPAYRFLAILYQEEFAGLLGIWQLSGSTFLEHFAVKPVLRGKGIGKESLETLVKGSRRPVVL
jgi:GNAT superfamily N-acetyltransferase